MIGRWWIGLDWTVPNVDDGLVVVDDIIRLKELAKVIRLLLRGNQVLLAAHLHPACFVPLRMVWPTHVWRTDLNREKLERHLQARHIEFPEPPSTHIAMSTDPAIWIWHIFSNAIPGAVLTTHYACFANTADWNNPL